MSGKKVPQFFIPASYKGHQTNPTPISSTNLYMQNSIGTNDTQRQRNLTNQLSTEINASSPGIIFGNGKPSDQRNPLLFPSPTGTLDLSHYNFVPTQTLHTTSSNKDTKSRRANGGISNQATTTNNRLNDALTDNNVNNNNADHIDSAQTVIIGEKEKKRRRFRRPRKNSKLDRLIRFLEDKRVKDDGNGEELEDLQMPRLRKVLNIIFVTLGVCFLLAVIIVILYTTFAGETDSFKDLCHHRNKLSSSCDNQTDLDHLELEDEDSIVSGIPHTHIRLSNSPTPEVTQKFPPMLMSSSEVEISHPTLSQKHYDTPALQSPLDVSISRIDGTNEGVTRGPLPPPPPDIYSYIDKLDDIYLTHTNNEGNYPWSHKVYNNPPIKEPINNHIQQPSNSKQQNDENSIWSDSWMQPIQHKTNHYETQLNTIKNIKKM
ncbi:hypothetical protein EWB00_002467 [Schistosoma japonicum]|uniref:Uncharacterized protein n=1 Tax=Schistosoma japonicum TaxID=6182 RepID=A0A4Z2DCS5_SCHJA|nr:hypothetical protein KSF78_0004025 [Schistosoma japonicum]TNN14259.1 hypothetical protein EWB00_002467 [Schistosoma japonicum]